MSEFIAYELEKNRRPSMPIKHSETIGMTILNPEGITSATLHTSHCGNCKHQRGDAICAGAHEPVNYECKDWEPEAKDKTEKQQVFGGTSMKELEEKQKGLEKVLHIESSMPDIQNERTKALDRGAKQGMTLEALETVFAIACQQVPSMETRWMKLKAEINIMFAQKWVAEDMPE